MRHIIFLLFLISFKLLPAQKWEHTFGNQYHNEYGMDVIETYDMGYLIMEGIEGILSGLIKTDINGNMLWNKYITDESPYEDIFSTVLSDLSGNIYLMGWRVVEFQDGWPLIVKLDSCGEQVWCRQFIDDENDWGWFEDAILLNNGDVLGIVQMESFDPHQVNQVFLYYITSDGELIWKKSYASKNDYPLISQRSPKVLQYINNMYIISGYCYYAYPNNPSHVYLRPMFIGVDTLFEEQFVLPFGMVDSITGKAYSAIPINDSVFLGAGEHWQFTDKDIYNYSLLMFFNTQGQEIKYVDIPNENIGQSILSNEMRQIAYINDSLIFATGYYGENYQGNDGGAFIFDTSGRVFGHISHPNTSARNSMIKTHDGKFVVVTSQKTGNFWDVLLYKVNDTLGTDTLYNGSFLYDSLCPYQIPSDTINLAGCLVTTNITDAPRPEDRSTQLHIFPNPASDELSIRYRIPGPGYQVFIYDMFGRKQDEITIPPGQEQVQHSISDYAPGIYVVVLRSKNGIVARGKFIKSGNR